MDQVTISLSSQKALCKDVGTDHLYDDHASYKSHRRAPQRLEGDLDAQRA